MLRTLVIVLSLALVTPASADKVPGYKTIYVVHKRDTLNKIARRLKTSVRKLRRWNHLRGSRIRLGQKLIYYSLIPPRPHRRLKHRIRRGDTLSKIAKKYSVSMASIRRLNRMGRRSRIIAGHTLKIEVVGPEKPSRAHGRPQHGTLEEGELLKSGPGWTIKKPRLAWGTNQTVTYLMSCIPKVRAAHGKNTADVIIGDLSRKGGGFLAPHKSHQNGLDVDIGYYMTRKSTTKVFRKASPKTLDVVRTWALLACFLATDDVEYIFIDRALQKPLYEYARRKGKKKRWLKQVFQYPRHGGRGIIRHQPSHINHFHIRFKAPGELEGTAEDA